LESHATEKSWTVQTGLSFNNVEDLVGAVNSTALKQALVRQGVEFDLNGAGFGEAFSSTPRIGYSGHLHFDAVTDVLLVLVGAKVVFLAPPPPPFLVPGRLAESKRLEFSFGGHTYSEPAASVSARADAGGDVTVNLEAGRAAFGSAPWRRFALVAGDALLLRRGWLHCVDTSPGSVAVSLRVMIQPN